MIDSMREPGSMMEMMVLALFCALIGLACVGGMAWALVGGEDVGVGRIFIVLVSLILALLFFGMAAWISRQARGTLGKKPEEAKIPDAAAAQPASKASAEKVGKSVS